MTNAAQNLIDSFEALPEEEKHEVLVQLLRRLVDTPYPPADEELLVAADLVSYIPSRQDQPRGGGNQEDRIETFRWNPGG